MRISPGGTDAGPKGNLFSKRTGLRVRGRRGIDSTSLELVKKGECQLNFITQEAVICNPCWRELLRTDIHQKNLVALFVDEAHYVKQCYTV